MPSSFSPSLRLEEQFTGENINVWGVKLNAAISRIDDAIAGYVPIAITGNYTIQSANTNTVADEARGAILKFTGTLAANATITIPSVSKLYSIWNATTKALVITTGSGSTVSIDTTDKVLVWCDGTNVVTPGYGGLSTKDYIAAQVISGGATFPAVVGNAGKFLYTDGASAYWKQAQATDLGDYSSNIIGKIVAISTAISRRR